MNVPENMNGRVDTMYRFQQIGTSSVETENQAIENAERRSVRHKNIRIIRNEVPMLPDVCTSLAIECPVLEPGLDRRAPDLYSFNLNTAVVEINYIFRN